MTTLILTLPGADRPGLVEAATGDLMVQVSLGAPT